EDVGEGRVGADAILQADAVDAVVGDDRAAGPAYADAVLADGVEREHSRADVTGAGVGLRVTGVDERETVDAQAVDAAAVGQVVRQGPQRIHFVGQLRVAAGIGDLVEQHVRGIRAAGRCAIPIA